jgi:hypothetical protein
MMFGREFSKPDIVVPEDRLEDQDDGWIERRSKTLGIARETALIKARTRTGG